MYDCCPWEMEAYGGGDRSLWIADRDQQDSRQRHRAPGRQRGLRVLSLDKPGRLCHGELAALRPAFTRELPGASSKGPLGILMIEAAVGISHAACVLAGMVAKCSYLCNFLEGFMPSRLVPPRKAPIVRGHCLRMLFSPDCGIYAEWIRGSHHLA